MFHPYPARAEYEKSGPSLDGLLFVVLHLDVVAIDASSEGARIDALFLGKVGGLFNVVVGRTVQFFFKDGVGLDGFKLGLEVT